MKCLSTSRPRGELIPSGPHRVPGLPEPLRVTAYLPPSYAVSDRAYPVAIFLDGQNLFTDRESFRGGWHLHELLDERDCRGERVPVVVALHTGGASRLSILSPWSEEADEPLADPFLDWIVGTLLEDVRGEVRLLPGPEHTLIGGASMGGLFALYGFFRHPESFGRVLAMSPSLGGKGGSLGPLFSYVERATRPPGKVYLDAGGRECPCGHVLRHAEAMAELLAGRGFHPGHQLKWAPDPTGDHDEWHWRRRLPGALDFLCDRHA